MPSFLASSTSSAFSETLVGLFGVGFLGPSNRARRFIAILLAHKIFTFWLGFNPASPTPPPPLLPRLARPAPRATKRASPPDPPPTEPYAPAGRAACTRAV